MLGNWEWYIFLVSHFVWLNVEHAAVCLSAVCVVWRQNNNRKYMTRNLASISTERSFSFSWLPQSIGKVCVYLIAYQTLWKENSLCPPSPLKICLVLTPLPLGISVTLSEGGVGGGGAWIFSGTTQYTPAMFMNYVCHTQSFFYPFWNRKLPAHIWLPCFATINQISTESVKYTFPIVLIMHGYEIKTL